MINNNNCSQLCMELEGSFNCSCYPGYELQQDRVSCKGNQIRTYMHTSTVHSHIQTFIHECVRVYTIKEKLKINLKAFKAAYI